MRKAAVTALVAGALALGGCAGRLPMLPDKSRISVADVVTRVQCELRLAIDAIPPGMPWPDRWVAAYTLTLKVEREQGAGINSIDWVVPFSGGTFRLGADASVTDNARRTMVVKFQTDLVDMRSYECPLDDLNKPDTAVFRGELGLREWVEQITEAKNTPKSFGYTVEFIVKETSGLRPGFSITHLNGTAGFKNNRSDTHTLDIAFADAPPSKPQKVEVVNFPVDRGKKASGPAIRVVDPSAQRELDTILQQLQQERKAN